MSLSAEKGKANFNLFIQKQMLLDKKQVLLESVREKTPEDYQVLLAIEKELSMIHVVDHE